MSFLSHYKPHHSLTHLGVAVGVTGVGEGGAEVGAPARVHKGQPVDLLMDGVLFWLVDCVLFDVRFKGGGV